MNGYSKIGSASHKSRSIDFSDFFSFPAQTPKPIRKTTTDLQAPKHEEPNDDNNEVNKKNKNKEAQSQKEDEEEGERFGVILGRSCSVSSGFQVTMKRAFSIRRSSSVSERYCRIHDQNMAMASDHEKKKQRRGGKILKTCKRLLGL